MGPGESLISPIRSERSAQSAHFVREALDRLDCPRQIAGVADLLDLVDSLQGGFCTEVNHRSLERVGCSRNRARVIPLNAGLHFRTQSWPVVEEMRYHRLEKAGFARQSRQRLLAG